MPPINHSCVSKLENNSKDVFTEASRILIKIADNILNDPSNTKIRTLQKGNSTIANRLLAAAGATECLFSMGFKEEQNTFVLPLSDALSSIKCIRDELVAQRELSLNSAVSCDAASASEPLIPNDSSSTGAVPKQKPQTSESIVISSASPTAAVSSAAEGVPLSPALSSPISSNPFLIKIQQNFHSARRYEIGTVQEKALKIIPLEELKENSRKKLTALQNSSKDKIDQATLQDLLLLELLAWYKDTFFKWVDSPECKFCTGKTQFVYISTDYSYAPTERVELHKCTTCDQLTPFPRYNDLSVLLTTRRGRCGEWANVFTLLCRALGWDARYVLDETDHVWTEVYSAAQERWLHCDPCENVCDTPLMYESGWGKRLSYVLAYSDEEVQDVTWRYTTDHRDVLTRRTRCSEADLVLALVTLREQRQKLLPPERKSFLTTRLLNELVDLMIERKPNDTEQQGRTSGSLTWRLARGETQTSADLSHTWRVTQNELAKRTFSLRYSPSLNKYQRISLENADVQIVETIDGWQNGVFKVNNVFRKEEKDWKMVYLTRTEGSAEGKIVWKVSIDDDDSHVIDKVNVVLTKALYENGKCNVEIIGNDEKSVEVADENFETVAFRSCKSIQICVHLSGGQGNVAWQHAQVFRQSTTDLSFPFQINVTFI